MAALLALLRDHDFILRIPVDGKRDLKDFNTPVSPRPQTTPGNKHFSAMLHDTKTDRVELNLPADQKSGKD